MFRFEPVEQFFDCHKCSVILTVSLNILICFMRFANGKQNSKLLFYMDLYLQ